MDGVRDRAPLPWVRRVAEGGAKFAGSRLPDPRGTAARPLRVPRPRVPRPSRVPGLPTPLPRSRCFSQPCPGVGKQTGFFVGAQQRRLWRAAARVARGALPSPCAPRPCPALPPAAGLSSSAGAGRPTCSEAVPCYIRSCSGASYSAHSCFPSALCKLLFAAACFLY